MFDIRELQIMIVFLERTNLTGQESITHASLLVKIKNMITSLTEKSTQKSA